MLTIKQAMKRLPGNGQDKAAALGISPAFVSMLENGKSGISVRLACRIARAAGLELDSRGDNIGFRERERGEDGKRTE